MSKKPLDSLLDEAKLLADDRPVEAGHLPQWTLDAEHMIRRLVKAFSTSPQPAQQESVAHCEGGPDVCHVCRAETRSLALAAAVGYIQRNTPPLVSTEICNALKTSPPAQRTWVGLSPADRGKCLSAGDAHGWIGVMEATEARLKELNT